MGELVRLDGRLIPLSEARISPLDRGFLYGDGLFETMRSYGGRVHLLRRHLARLAEGGRVIGLTIPSEEELRIAVREVLGQDVGGDARVRITVSRGVDPDGPPTVFIRRQPLLQKEGIQKNEKIDAAESPDGEDLILFPSRRSVPEIRPRLKSLNYLPEILAQDDLRRRGLREGLFLTAEGYVAEGSVSNIFCVIDGTLRTPPVELGILPGITRGRVIELAHAAGIPVAEHPFLPEEMMNGEECFYTNSVRELVPVRSLEGRLIGGGKAGPVTRRLMRFYRAELPDEEL